MWDVLVLIRRARTSFCCCKLRLINFLIAFVQVLAYLLINTGWIAGQIVIVFSPATNLKSVKMVRGTTHLAVCLLSLLLIGYVTAGLYYFTVWFRTCMEWWELGSRVLLFASTKVPNYFYICCEWRDRSSVNAILDQNIHMGSANPIFMTFL